MDSSEGYLICGSDPCDHMFVVVMLVGCLVFLEVFNVECGMGWGWVYLLGFGDCVHFMCSLGVGVDGLCVCNCMV